MRYFITVFSVLFVATAAHAHCADDAEIVKLKATTAACTQGKQCPEFIAAMKQVWPHKQCSGQQAQIIDEAYALLSKLKTPEGKAYYCSTEFSNHLDGYFSEDYQPAQEQVGDLDVYYKTHIHCDQ